MAGERAVGAAPSGPAPPVDARRRQILRAAARVIGERGYSDARVTDVSHAAGVSSALVIYYFGTRDRLLTAALRHAEDTFYEALAAAVAELPDAAGRLAQIVELVCTPTELDDMPGSWVLWLDVLAQALRHPELERDRVELDARWRGTIAEVVRDGVQSGQFRPVPVEDFSLLLTAVLDGLALQLVLDDPVVTAERARTLIAGLCRDYLGIELAAPVTRRRPRPAPRRRSAAGAAHPPASSP